MFEETNTPEEGQSSDDPSLKVIPEENEE